MSGRLLPLCTSSGLRGKQEAALVKGIETPQVPSPEEGSESGLGGAAERGAGAAADFAAKILGEMGHISLWEGDNWVSGHRVIGLCRGLIRILPDRRHKQADHGTELGGSDTR